MPTAVARAGRRLGSVAPADVAGGAAGLPRLRKIRQRSEMDPQAQLVMLVGHNPAFENLARRLVGGGASKLGRRREEKFPTAALAVIDFPCARWSGIGEGSGHLAHFVRPRDLAQD